MVRTLRVPRVARERARARGLGCPMWFGGGSGRAVRVAAGLAGCAVSAFAASLAHGDTLESALVQAYLNNPSLNSQRAAVRVTDENVPQALSGYRPKITVTATGGQQSVSSLSQNPNPMNSTVPTCTNSVRRLTIPPTTRSKAATTRRSRSAPPSPRRSTTATRPPTKRGKPNRKCWRRAQLWD